MESGSVEGEGAAAQRVLEPATGRTGPALSPDWVWRQKSRRCTAPVLLWMRGD